MSDQNRTAMENAALALYYHAAQMIKEGKSDEEVLEDLVSKGVNPETAASMLEKLNESRANVAQRRGYRNVFIGIVLIVLMIFPISGIGVPQVFEVMLGIALLIMGYGIYTLGRGIMQITGL